MCQMSPRSVVIVFFFFQAEDGIRDFHVTGVQTCALPIYRAQHATGARGVLRRLVADHRLEGPEQRLGQRLPLRSEERRVGKEWRSRGSPYHEKKTTTNEVQDNKAVSRKSVQTVGHV